MNAESGQVAESGVPFNLPEPKEKTRLVTLNMPVDLIDELDDLAKSTGNSRTKLIIHFCKAALEQLKVGREQESDGAKPRAR